jgi:hypothetical protein
MWQNEYNMEPKFDFLEKGRGRCFWCGAEATIEEKYCSKAHKKVYARFDELSEEEKNKLIDGSKEEKDEIKQKLYEGV